MTLTYKARSAAIDMPGWHCGECDESLHDGEDMKVSDRALNRLLDVLKTETTKRSAWPGARTGFQGLRPWRGCKGRSPLPPSA